MDRIREIIGEYLVSASQRFAWYRAHLLAIAGGLLGLLEVVDPYALASILPPRYNGLVLIGMAVAVWLLRRLMATKPSPPSPDMTEASTEE